jgi:histidine triad (HIT) family protein
MTYNHAPDGYKCPICIGLQGIESEDTLLKQADLVFRDDLVSVFVNSFWIDTAKGHVIVVPNEHYENIYELPSEVGYRISEVVKKVATAMRIVYQCDGITTRQNNEPAGNQHAFHYHHHIFPRYDGDSYNENMTKKSILSKPEERIVYVNKLKEALKNV